MFHKEHFHRAFKVIKGNEFRNSEDCYKGGCNSCREEVNYMRNMLSHTVFLKREEETSVVSAHACISVFRYFLIYIIFEHDN